jgi:hypothetical protein
MATANLTDPRWARIWVNCTDPTTTPTPTPPGAKKLCAINSKAINQSLATGTAVLPDCDNPVIVSSIKRTPISKDAAITGSGYFELDMRGTLQTIMDSAISVDVCFEIMSDGSSVGNNNDGFYHGKFFLETFNIIANNSDSYMTVDVNFTADGPVAWTANTHTP